MNKNEDKFRAAAENVLLVFVSRWSTVLLVPIILGVGSWIVTNIQSLNLAVANLQQQVSSQAVIYDQKLLNTNNTLGIRMDSAEKRIGRLETQFDRELRKPVDTRR